MKNRESRVRNETNNPCLKEHELSYKCMNENSFDREKCSVQFLNYNNCNEFWNRVKADRRSKGIVPYLPPPEEREQIKAEHFKHRNK